MPTLDRLRNIKKRLAVVAASIVLMALSACATAPAPNEVTVRPTGAVRSVDQTDGTAVWVKGHYSYVRGRYVWVPGHWRY